MKVVRMQGNVVAEIIPEYALPVDEWYGEHFASKCREVSDDVQEGYVYDPVTGTFSDPSTIKIKPTTEERLTALEEQLVEADETAIYLFEMQMAQEQINAAQDDALIEIYEMIGG